MAHFVDEAVLIECMQAIIARQVGLCFKKTILYMSQATRRRRRTILVAGGVHYLLWAAWHGGFAYHVWHDGPALEHPAASWQVLRWSQGEALSLWHVLLWHHLYSASREFL